MTDSDYVALADQIFAQEGPGADVQPLGAILLSEFTQARLDRQETEGRWLEDLRQYKGQYSEREIADMQGSSRAFVRKTRTKVKTVNARVADMLFPAGGQDAWSFGPTPVPELSAHQQAIVAQRLQEMQQQGQQADQGTIDTIVQKVAKEAAEGMARVVSDQLVETGYRREALKAIHDAHVYGTGALKGPVVSRRARTAFRQINGRFVPETETYVTPQVEHVPLWQLFPDMSSSCLEGCRYVWQRHLMAHTDVAELCETPGFDAQRLRSYLEAHPKGYDATPLEADAEIRRIGMRLGATASHTGYEVLERWGYLSGRQLSEVGVEVAPERMHETFFGCVWLLPTGEVVRAHLLDIDGTTWPYHLYHFDKDETSFFAEGLSAIMRDDQAMINSATRLLLDNAALSAGPMFEVSPHLLSSADSASVTDIHAWRVWLRNSQSPNQRAVVPVGIDGRLGDLQQIKQMFETNADETTAIPRYMSGENATAGAAGTATGMSMLMAAANIVIKDLITSWDEGVTRPLIEAMYRWNMRHSRDDSIKGDYQVAATGTSSLVAKEVRSRQLNEFAAMTANALDAPYIKRDVLNRLRAQAHELPEVIKSEQEVEQEAQAAQANPAQEMQMQMMQLQMQEAAARTREIAARAELQLARAQESAANAELAAARKLDATMEAVYAALQAAGISMQSPNAAPVADAILRDGGYEGAEEKNIAQARAMAMAAEQQAQQQAQGQQQPGQPPAMPQGPAPVQPATGHGGMRQGIETRQMGDGQ